MWPRVLSIAAGLWLMAAPGVSDYDGAARTNDTIVGALAVTSAIIALSEVMRPIRWVNAALGVWLLLAPWPLGFVMSAHRMFAGVVLVSSAVIRGRIGSQFGGGWSALWRSADRVEEPHAAP